MEDYDSTSIIVKQFEKLASSDYTSDDGAWWFFWTTSVNDDNGNKCIIFN